MIRRAIKIAGRPQWLIMRQIEHARLSAELAQVWRGLRDVTATCRQPKKSHAALLQAIRRHDDGWLDWDVNLSINRQTSIPRDFTEMRREQSLAIWSASIHEAEDLGSLGQWVIARHFLAFWQDRSAKDDIKRQFVDEFQPLSAQWQNQLQSTGGWRDASLRRLGSVLPQFDVLSLQLCGIAAGSAFSVENWNDEAFHFHPRSNAREFSTVGEKPWEVAYQVTPWPFTVDEVELTSESFVVDPALMTMNLARDSSPMNDLAVTPAELCLTPVNRRQAIWLLKP